MFITKKSLSRRTFLRGAGVTIALPFLESMVPAQTPLRTAASPKTRFGAIYIPHADGTPLTAAIDWLIEVSPKGEILWQWVASDHIDELGFSAEARNAIKAAPGVNAGRGSFDWLHINSATYVGRNHWFDEGNKRFAPNNVIISSRQASFIAIVARDGSIAWRIGPDFTASKELRAIRQIIGQHHAHLIPKGLPGAGNLLVFDNGGASGYGFPNPNAPDGSSSFARANSRVLEINPLTLQLVWSYAGPKFYSSNISGAQRLPNGNTLITEGASGRMFEVTKEGKIVWEYIYPDFGGGSNNVYRAVQLGAVMHNHAVPKNCEVAGGHSAAETWRLEDNIKRLPFSRLAGNVDERRPLAIDRSHHAVGISAVVVGVQNLNFIAAHEDHAAVAAILA